MRYTRRRRAARHQQETAELNITAFMNLMVILVPFLLITAVFTRTAVLELTIPAADNASAEQPPRRPQVVLYEDRLEFSDGQGEPLSLPRSAGETELLELREWLLRFKASLPGNQATQQALLLVAPEVDYESLIRVMDFMRSHPVPAAGGGTELEPLFPDISLGDAPAGDTP